jgi:hypothetical protein
VVGRKCGWMSGRPDAGGASVSELFRSEGQDRKTIGRLVREGPPGPRGPRQVDVQPGRGVRVRDRAGAGSRRVTDATVLFDQIRARGDTGWWRPSVY